MKIKKNSRLIIAILTILAITGFLQSVFETFNETSDDNVMISPKLSSSFTISAPDSLSSWGTGTAEWIHYTATSDVLTVNISLYNEGVFVTYIDEFTPVTPGLYWNIPEDLATSDQYQIRISDYYNWSNHIMSQHFEIFESSLGAVGTGLAGMGPTIVIISLGVIVALCITNRIVRKIILNKRRQ